MRESKVLIFMEEVVFKIRKPLTKNQLRANEAKRKGLDPIKRDEVVITQDDLNWAADMGMTEEQYRRLREEDQFDPNLDSVVVPDILIDDEGDLLKFHSINTSYVSALAEMYKTQVSLGINHDPQFRGEAFNSWMEMKAKEQDQLARERFEDRGAGGINATYSDEDFIRYQESLFKSSAEKPAVSPGRLPPLPVV